MAAASAGGLGGAGGERGSGAEDAYHRFASGGDVERQSRRSSVDNSRRSSINLLVDGVGSCLILGDCVQLGDGATAEPFPGVQSSEGCEVTFRGSGASDDAAAGTITTARDDCMDEDSRGSVARSGGVIISSGAAVFSGSQLGRMLDVETRSSTGTTGGWTVTGSRAKDSSGPRQ